jgi:hypothetical protein
MVQGERGKGMDMGVGMVMGEGARGKGRRYCVTGGVRSVCNGLVPSRSLFRGAHFVFEGIGGKPSG